MKKMKLVLMVVLCASFVVSSPGCGGSLTAEQVAGAKQQAQTTKETLQAQKAEQERLLALAQAAQDPTAIAKAEKSLATILKLLKGTQVTIDTLNSATKPDGTLDLDSGLAASIGSLAPLLAALGPAGIVGSVLMPFGGWIFTQIRLGRAKAAVVDAKNTSHAIVNSIDVARAGSPEFDAAFKKVGPVVAAEQAKTEGTHEFVESSRV